MCWPPPPPSRARYSRVARWATTTGEGGTAGPALLLLGTGLGVVVVATGSGVGRAIADWWTLATVVRDDGGAVDVTRVSSQTQRLHDLVTTEDRADGRGELWRPPLLAWTGTAVTCALIAAGAAVMAVADQGEVTVPYASDEVGGHWLTVVLVAVIALLCSAVTASGLRRIHRARMHRTART